MTMTPKPQFTFLSMPTFEHWDWLNPDAKGIGGSETSHIQMAQRLKKRGCDVRSYGPTPYTGPMTDETGLEWRWWDKAFDAEDEGQALDRAGVWVVYRDPQAVDFVPQGFPIWMICQDVDYDTWTPERIARCTRIVALCEEQKRFLEYHHPEMCGRVCVSSNGVRPGLIEQMRRLDLPRNPKRLIYPSSPDRGLMNLVPIFERAREIDHELELHVYYGFDNIEKVVEREAALPGNMGLVAKQTQRIRDAINKPGIVVHGRTGQKDLAREWAQSGIWCHPSNFQETSCITCMDAQAFGAIPITNPIWAVGENVEHGVFIEGNAANYVVRGLYALELVRLASDPIRQQEIRRVMMPWARDRFTWETFTDQWMSWAVNDTTSTSAGTGVASRSELAGVR